MSDIGELKVRVAASAMAAVLHEEFGDELAAARGLDEDELVELFGKTIMKAMVVASELVEDPLTLMFAALVS